MSTCMQEHQELSAQPCALCTNPSLTAGVWRLTCQEVPDGLVVKATMSQGHKCTVHDLKVMGSNPSQVELGMHNTYVYAVLEPKLWQIYSRTCR